MRFVVHRDANAFLQTALSWLLEREVECNLILGIALARAQSGAEGSPAWFATIEEGERILGAVFRTPPHMLGVTAMPTGATPLVARMAGEAFDDLPGIVGDDAAAQAVASVWAAGRPVRARLEMRLGIFEAEQITAPTRPIPGRLVPAPPDVDLLARWMEGFEEDTGIFSTGARENVERLLDAEALWVWKVNEKPVAMAGLSGATPNTVRVGYVYTPPAHRGRGYASAATATLSQAMLDQGQEKCTLYANLADPVSTGIYRRLGYRQVATSCTVRFDEG